MFCSVEFSRKRWALRSAHRHCLFAGEIGGDVAAIQGKEQIQDLLRYVTYLFVLERYHPLGLIGESLLGCADSFDVSPAFVDLAALGK